jgi:hypothetical protein
VLQQLCPIVHDATVLASSSSSIVVHLNRVETQ